MPWRLPRTVDPQPSLAIDMGKDAVSVIDPNTNALIASASLAQVTATPAEFKCYAESPNEGWETRAVLVVRVPGAQPLSIGCLSRVIWGSRFSSRGKVPRVKLPEFLVSAADWRALVSAWPPNLEDKARR
jgi:hypothetical protein